MAVSRGGKFGAAESPRTGIGVGLRHLVVAGRLEPDARPAFEGALAFALNRHQALVVLDLDRQTLTVGPRFVGGDTRLAIVGDLDLATIEILSAALSIALRQHPAAVVLDLRRLEFIDAQSARLIARASARMGTWAGALTLQGPQRAITRVFDLCGLGGLLLPPQDRVDSPRPTQHMPASA